MRPLGVVFHSPALDDQPGFAVVVLILGLPVVLATAFVQEGVGAEEAPGEAPAASEAAEAATPADSGGLHLVLTRRNVVLGGVVVVALAGVGVAAIGPWSFESLRRLATFPARGGANSSLPPIVQDDDRTHLSRLG